ncbi:hypothetical protein BKA62DRAFT_704324 [Auriculariales sp. MPI-PUGE-AT-0066]|nr:hypothetical protein BKA62DRAFT_704324 [Auriculariales sp. MPI-PUGE-AT-0066]
MAQSVLEDILLLVFDQISGPALLDWPRAFYSHERAQAPFVLAGVCQRWRLLARSTPALWSYFGFPSEYYLHERHVARLQILVSLVNQAPIDVVLAIDLWSGYERKRARMHPETCKIVDVIISLATQWRSADFDLRDNNVRLFYDLIEELPQLQQLSLTCANGGQDLGNAHNMKRLHYNCYRVRFNCSLPHFPSVTSFYCGTSQDVTTKALCISFSENLVELAIACDAWDEPPMSIMFSRLCTLILYDSRFLAHIKAPNLHTLALQGSSVIKGLKSYASGHASVQHLILYGTVGEQVVYNLEHLRFISRLSFSVPGAIRGIFDQSAGSYEIMPAFFTELLVAQPPVWPALEHLDFAPLNYAYPFQRPFPFQRLSAFIESRNMDHGACGNGAEETARSSVIKTVILPEEEKVPVDGSVEEESSPFSMSSHHSMLGARRTGVRARFLCPLLNFLSGCGLTKKTG